MDKHLLFQTNEKGGVFKLKKTFIFFSILLLITLSACTFVNPNHDSSLTNSEQTTEVQTKRLTEEEAIRYNMYPNPYESYERRETRESLNNSNGHAYGNPRSRAEQDDERNEQHRTIYYQLRQMNEIREAGISIQDDRIYVAINLGSRADEDTVIGQVKEVVEKVTGRSDITVWVDREFHNRIEDRKK